MMYAVLSTIEPDRSQAHAPAWAGAGGMGLPLSPCPELGTWSGYPPANTSPLPCRFRDLGRRTVATIRSAHWGSGQSKYAAADCHEFASDEIRAGNQVSPKGATDRCGPTPASRVNRLGRLNTAEAACPVVTPRPRERGLSGAVARPRWSAVWSLCSHVRQVGGPTDAENVGRRGCPRDRGLGGDGVVEIKGDDDLGERSGEDAFEGSR
jgi:hypothetical protein